jgi:hypothetical protein
VSRRWPKASRLTIQLALRGSNRPCGLGGGDETRRGGRVSSTSIAHRGRGSWPKRTATFSPRLSTMSSRDGNRGSGIGDQLRAGCDRDDFAAVDSPSGGDRHRGDRALPQSADQTSHHTVRRAGQPSHSVEPRGIVVCRRSHRRVRPIPSYSAGSDADAPCTRRISGGGPVSSAFVSRLVRRAGLTRRCARTNLSHAELP